MEISGLTCELPQSVVADDWRFQVKFNDLELAGQWKMAEVAQATA